MRITLDRKPMNRASIASLLVLLAACAGGASPVGVSKAKPEGRTTPAGAASSKSAPSPLPLDYRTKFEKLTKAPMESQGHAAGRFEVEIFANELASRALKDKVKLAPIGAVVIKEHRERAPSLGGAPGPTMMMEKRQAGFAPDRGDWQYTVVNSKGELVAGAGLDACAGCHEDAPYDHLFALPSVVSERVADAGIDAR